MHVKTEKRSIRSNYPRRCDVLDPGLDTHIGNEEAKEEDLGQFYRRAVLHLGGRELSTPTSGTTTTIAVQPCFNFNTFLLQLMRVIIHSALE